MNTHSRLSKAIAHMLIGVMWLQPLFSLAAELRVDATAGGNTQITQAGNGVPMVIIAKPNEKGLSHNKFTDYNVDQQGLILNNSTEKFTQTQLGGTIIGNGYLQGKPAQIILNEVNGGQASQLKGYTEVAGKQAHVVVANPHGITCDGCGFINTPHVTLATGKPIVEQGQLSRYEVDDGKIDIVGAGLNASNISQFDLITRSAQINAELHANQLNIITGRNSVDAQTLTATAKKDRLGDKPNLAIDSSALGGMYAGAIRLVGTETGVGVKLAGDMAASSGDIQIDANGKLTLARASATQQIKVTAQQVDLTQQVYAGDQIQIEAEKLSNNSNLLAANNIDLSVGQIDNQGLIEAGLRADNTLNSTADVRIKSTTLTNSGSVIASRYLQIDSNEQVSNKAGQLVGDTVLTVSTKQLDNQQGLITAAGKVNVSAEQIDNRNQGEISSQKQLTVRTDTLDNSNSGRVISEADLSVTVQNLYNHQAGILAAGKKLTVDADIIDNSNEGVINAAQTLVITAKTLNNQDGGRVLSNADLQLDTQQLKNTDGLLDAQGQLSIQAQSIDNMRGLIVGESGVYISSDSLDNRADGLVLSHGELNATVSQLNNQQGTLVADAGVILKGQTLNNDAGRIASENIVRLDQAQLNNIQGLIAAGNDVTVTAQTIDNAKGELSAGQALTLDTQLLQQKQGQILSAGEMNLTAQVLDNSEQGLISAGTALNIQAGRLDNQQQGAVISDGVLSIQANQLNNYDKGLLASKGNLHAQLKQLDQHNQGELISTEAIYLNLSAGNLNNSQGGLIYAPQLQLNQVALLNNSQGGEISASNNLALNAQQLNNEGGIVSSGQTLQIRVEGVINNTLQGLLSAGHDLRISGQSLDNSQKGTLVAKSSLSLQINEQIDNSQNGAILANGQLQLNSATLKNTQNGLISSQRTLDIRSAAIDNSQGGEISSLERIVLNVGDLNNQQGYLISEGSLELTHPGQVLNNRAGLIHAVDGLVLNNLQDVDNSHGGEISSQNSFQFTLDNLNNSQGGVIVSHQQLDIAAKHIDNQQEGLLSGLAGLQVSADSLQNQHHGTLSSRAGELTVQVVGQINNSDQGAFVSQKAMNVQAGGLENQQGIISAEADVVIEVLGDIDNQRGQISGLGVVLSADNLFNSAGQVSADQTLAITLAKQLLNQQDASIISGQELLLTANTINNQNSMIASEGLLSVFAQHLRNEQQATIAANDHLELHAQKVGNQGDIYSQNAGVTVQADTFSNNNGLIQARDGLDLDIAQQLVNQNGRIISEQGAVSVQAQTVDNQEGVFASLLDRLALSVRGLFNNQFGTAQGQSMMVEAYEVANQGGHLAATATDFELSAAVLNNRGGGIYAKQLFAVSGQNLDNSAQGKIGANIIDFSLTGELNNQTGLIEADHLHMLAGSINNSQGLLRALAHTGGSVIGTSGTFDNRNGSIEINNTNFTLDAPNLMNESGYVAHAGSGQFDLMSGHAQDVGGTVASQGDLTITSDSWENSTHFQAGVLTFNVGNFKQTAAGQLIASHSLIATGDTWVNEGLIASDGSLTLNLIGNYSGNGQVISLGDMLLSANEFALGQPAVIYSEGASHLNSQKLTNQGYISAADSLAIDTQRLINQGTLGSAQQLSISAPYLSNDSALIFSGADMILRVGQLRNRYADVYSLSNIDLAGYVPSSQAQRVENISASMEAAGDFSLRSAVVENRRDILEVENKGKYSVVISELACYGPYNPNGDCKLGSNGRRNGVWQITELEKLEVINSSTTSNLLAGGNFSLTGEKLTNSSSLISSGTDLSLGFGQVNNIGVKPADIEVQRIFVSGRKPDYYTYRGLADDFNAKHGPSPQKNSVEQDLSYFISRMESEYLLGRERNETPLAGEEYSAIIQAGGNVTINAQQTLENSVIRPSYNYVSGGSRVDTRTPGRVHASEVSINSQLPPDLQQKQIDPTALPGFNLPTGDKGLFRLSDQAAQDMQAQGTNGINPTTGSGSVRGYQLAQQGSQSLGRDVLLRSQLGGSNPAQGSYEKSQAQFVLTNLQNLQGHNNGHRYLIETNPALTQMRQSLSSDYLFSGLGLNSDQIQKRLGDGLYEQKLMREALVARTGQRFIAGLTSDEALFRYLMDNAIASKDSLNLSVGVSLSAEQVAALTHDIVWLEEREVLGEQVLTPVLYLAQAEGRLAPNGALIQGQDLTLVSGGNLSNQGTLRASNNLSAHAQSISNSGLVHAGERLSLLAEDSIYNRQSGILAGRDVDLTARTGDILNERTITRHKSAAGNSRWESSFADSAARIEATRDLALSAGRDVHNLGSVLDSRGDLHISAGRDVNLASVEDRHSTIRGKHYLNTQTQQLGSETLAAGNLSIQAGRDLTAVASRVESGKDMQLIAGNDLTFASAANESHHFSKSKKATNQHDQVRQVGTQVRSGSQFVAVAGQDLTLVSSSIAAHDDAYLVAGGKVQLLAEQDNDYSFYEKKKKGSFGRKSYRMSESSNNNAIASTIKTGSDLNIYSDDSILSEGARLQAGKQINLHAGNDIEIMATLDSHSQTQAKSKQGLLSSKAKTSSQSYTTAAGSELIADNILINTGRDLRIAASHIRSEADTYIQAGRDISLTNVEQQSSQSSSKQSSRLGGSYPVLLTYKQKQSSAQQKSTEAVGSYISADNLSIHSGRDTQIQGSTLIVEQGMQVAAGRHLNIESADNTTDYSSSSSSTQIGGIGQWWQPAVGQVKQKAQAQSKTTQQSAAQLVALEGNIDLKAGENYQQTASQVLALSGDIDIQAKQVAIQAGYDLFSQSEKQSSSRTAVGGTVNVPLVDAVQSMQQVGRAATRIDDSRMQALAAATLAMQGKDVYDSAKALSEGSLGGVKISISLSNDKSKSQSSQQGRNVVSSSVIAGGDVRIKASEAEDSDLSIIGSIVQAGHDLQLQADRYILLKSAENTAEQRSKNNGSGLSAGIGVGLGGTQNGFTLDLAANQFRGKTDGKDSVWSNTRLEAGNQVHLESGKDTVLQGAVVEGEQVTASVGRDLILESLQDTSTHKSKQSGSSVGARLCIPPYCAGASSGNVSHSRSKAKGDYASVNEQTGIQAGDGGFQLEVQGHTDLTGAVIASSEKAVEGNLNRLETGTLEARHIENYAKANASSTGVSLSTDMFTQGKYGVAKGVIGNGLNQGSAKDSSSGQTLTAVSAGEVIIKDELGQLEKTGQTVEQAIAELNRDTDNTHTAAERLDIQELERDAEAQRIIKQAVFAEAVKFTDDAYHTMFIKEHKMYEVIIDEDGNPIKSADGIPQIRELSLEEKKNLKANGAGKVHVAANGIFNDEYDAAMYAAQNNPETTGGSLYIVSFPKTDSLVAELMVAGYQKHLENDFWGLTNSTEQFKEIMQQYGMSGLELDAHSRGSMTVGNAMQSLASDSKTTAGVLGETSVNFFGPAYSAEKAAGLLYGLSGGKQDKVSLQNHKDDFVGVVLGGNQASHGTVPEGSNKIKEWVNIVKDSPTVHSCYGSASDECKKTYGQAHTVEVKHK